MALRSGGRQLSFEILASGEYDVDDILESLSRSNSDPMDKEDDPPPPATPSKSKRKRNRKKGAKIPNPVSENSAVHDEMSYSCMTSTVTVTETCMVPERTKEDDGSCVVPRPVQFGELRQRNVSSTVNGGESPGLASEETGKGRNDENANDLIGGEHRRSSSSMEVEPQRRGSSVEVESHRKAMMMNGRKSGDPVDWNKLMADDPKSAVSEGKSPVRYFMEEMYAGNSLRSTTTLGNDEERERVYDTIFRLPWRCELLLDVGFFVCLDAFLSIFTIMPTRIGIICWRLLKTRQFRRPSSAELSDLASFLILVAGISMLQLADISLIYHMIRGQGTIKLYVVYNVLEIFDKLCQSFGGDIVQALFNSADGLATCSPENMQFWLWRFIYDEALAIISSIVHSFILLAQAITLSTCIVAHNNALFAMLVSNNFAEIKSNVFKRYSKANVQSLVYFDSIERFHISAFILFVLAQNMLEAEGPWFQSFLCNAMVVYMCEVIIDIIKHSFIAKFNDIKPIAFSEFLEDLCKQVLNIESENAKNHLTFLPLAPACVVIRVFRPVYAAHLPHSPFVWRFFWILILLVITFVMLTSLKIMIGMALRKHAQWYIKRCENRKLHSD